MKAVHKNLIVSAERYDGKNIPTGVITAGTHGTGIYAKTFPRPTLLKKGDWVVTDKFGRTDVLSTVEFKTQYAEIK